MPPSPQKTMYCTQLDIERKIGAQRVAQWADDGSGVIDIAITTAAILSGDTKINAALAQRFSAFLPFVTPPPMVFQISVTFAMWSLACRMQETSDLWRAQYEEAVLLLQQLADGKIDLIAADGTNLTAQSDYAPITQHAPVMAEQDPRYMSDALYYYRTRNAGVFS